MVRRLCSDATPLRVNRGTSDSGGVAGRRGGGGGGVAGGVEADGAGTGAAVTVAAVPVTVAVVSSVVVVIVSGHSWSTLGTSSTSGMGADPAFSWLIIITSRYSLPSRESVLMNRFSFCLFNQLIGRIID